MPRPLLPGNFISICHCSTSISSNDDRHLLSLMNGNMTIIIAFAPLRYVQNLESSRPQKSSKRFFVRRNPKTNVYMHIPTRLVVYGLFYSLSSLDLVSSILGKILDTFIQHVSSSNLSSSRPHLIPRSPPSHLHNSSSRSNTFQGQARRVDVPSRRVSTY